MSPLGPPGSRLWGREAWGFAVPLDERECSDLVDSGEGFRVLYRADDPSPFLIGEAVDRWRPATHISRHLSRFPDLTHTSCRVVRVSSLSEGDVASSGACEWAGTLDGRTCDNAERAAIQATRRRDPSAPFVAGLGFLAAAWDRENPRHPWSSDPWAWVCLVERGEGA
jgi:hypothetical protein